MEEIGIGIGLVVEAHPEANVRAAINPKEQTCQDGKEKLSPFVHFKVTFSPPEANLPLPKSCTSVSPLPSTTW